MEKKMILLFGIILILASVLAVAFSGVTFTGRSIDELGNIYSYTKAICNSSNECQDFLVVCESSEVKSLSPMSGVVKFEEDWIDFREKEGFC